MKKIYSSIMAVALFASALSCTSGNNNNTNNAGTQTAQTQALDSDGIPTGGEWITMFDGKTLNGWRGYCRQDVPQGWVVEDGSITYKGSDNKADTGFGDLIYDKKFKNFVFEIEWKIDKAGNSGIFYTAQELRVHLFITPAQNISYSTTRICRTHGKVAMVTVRPVPYMT